MGFEEVFAVTRHGYLGSLLVHLCVVSMRSRHLVYSVSTAFCSFEILVCLSSSYITFLNYLNSINSSDLQINLELMKAGIGQPKYR